MAELGTTANTSLTNVKGSLEVVRGRASAKKPPAKDKLNNDVQQFMNIHHFEELMRIFQEEKREDSSGFDIDKFREVFGKVFRNTLSYDQLTMLFMKIDANSDGTVDWDEFSTYMMMGTINSEEQSTVLDERAEAFVSLPDVPHPHRDMIKKVEYVAKERKYLSISREGMICIWGSNLKLQRQIDTKEFAANVSWVSDAVCLSDQGKLATACDDRKIYIYEVFSIKPRLLAVFGPLEDAPLCIGYTRQYDDTQDLLIWGDDGGCVNILLLTRRFFVDHVTEDKPAFVDPTILLRKEMQDKYHLNFQKRRVHNDWVSHVQFYNELNGYISCSSDSVKSLAIGDIERRTVRYLNVQRGIKYFDFCRRPSFLVTGGRDKIIRLWNPYVLSKPAGSLVGHNSSIAKIVMNNEHSHIISMSDDKVIKLWNARNLQCLQTLVDKAYHRPENFITAMFFDSYNKKLVLGHDSLEVYVPHQRAKKAIARSHDAPVVAALYNESFHQVVSSGTDSMVRVWTFATGERTYQFAKAQNTAEVTSIAFDTTCRRLLTASRDGVIRMWNFNNGQMLQQMKTTSRTEITQVIHRDTPFSKMIISVGWDQKIAFFLDDPGNLSSEPLKELNASENKATMQRGHTDDILALDFILPNCLVTGGLDGFICVWNSDSGHCRAVLKEPYLHLRGPEEKAVEKVLFMVNKHDDEIIENPYLVSGSSDGYIRFWNVSEAKLVHETCCQIRGNEGVTSLALSPDCDVLVVGDTDGTTRVYHIRMKELQKPKPDYTEFCELEHIWKAHVKPITSVEFIKKNDLVLTSSKDGSIRVWTIDGKHVGILGSEECWDLNDTLTYASYPPDVVDLQTMEKSIPAKAALLERQMKLKAQVIQKFRIGPLGINPDMLELVELELQQLLGEIHVDFDTVKKRAIMKATVSKWKSFVAKKHVENRSKKTEEDFRSCYSGKEFFKYSEKKQNQVRSLKKLEVKSDSAFHSLHYHQLSEMIVPSKPSGLERNYKKEKDTAVNKLYSTTVNIVLANRNNTETQQAVATPNETKSKWQGLKKIANASSF